MARITQNTGKYFIFQAILIFFINFFSDFTNAEVVVQNVLWTREYEGVDENYFGTCRFVQTPCGMNYEGVCVQRGRCFGHGGQPVGDCQGETGECCHFTQSCLGNDTRVDVTQLVTILTSPEYFYDTQSSQCTFKIRKQPNICQVRLDFQTFTSTEANYNGDCDTDRLRISNSITVDNDFTTCGDLTNQHMYLTFGEEESIDLSSMLRSPNSNYRIKTTMIPCQSRHRAPDYCLQYYTQPNGRVVSFDFARQQQSSQRYAVCVKPSEGSRSVQWKPCADGPGKSFDIATSSPDVPIGPPLCNADWVQVKGLGKVCEPFGEISSVWKPYELLVNFDELEVPPPPPHFDIPMDPGNCEATCEAQSVPGVVTCACLSSPPTCQCITESIGPIQVDFNNTGFCLEYSQF